MVMPACSFLSPTGAVGLQATSTGLILLEATPTTVLTNYCRGYLVPVGYKYRYVPQGYLSYLPPPLPPPSPFTMTDDIYNTYRYARDDKKTGVWRNSSNENKLKVVRALL
jgi:hypothetical protein